MPLTRPATAGLWVKVKCLHREEFVVVGWTDPEGSRPFLGALLLAYYDPDGRLVYAGRAGTGIKQEEAGTAAPPPATAWYRQHAARGAAAAHQPFRDRRWCSAACIGRGPNWSPK